MMTTKIEIRTAAQVLQELNDTDERTDSEKYINLYTEWRELVKEEAAAK